MDMIKAKAHAVITPHNSNFIASKFNGWVQKFMARNGLSLCCKTSISQKLPAQLENKIECYLTQVRAFRARHQYPLELIINMDETPMYFDMLPGRTVNKKSVKTSSPLNWSREEKAYCCSHMCREWRHLTSSSHF